jgi:hypothetical protein
LSKVQLKINTYAINPSDAAPRRTYTIRFGFTKSTGVFISEQSNMFGQCIFFLLRH